MNPKKLIYEISRQEAYKELLEVKEKVIGISGLSGSAFSIAVSYYAENFPGVHIFVAGSKDEAGYMTNDLEELFGGDDVYFFPSGYKKSILYGQESPSGMVHRTALLERLSKMGKKDTVIICTYPEALAEKVASGKEVSESSIILKKGDKTSVTSLTQRLEELGFVRVEFVYEPNQYSVRGGIVDIFSFSGNMPYRVDFFGDEIDSIRTFDAGSQRSVGKTDNVTVVANLGTDKAEKVTLFEFISSSRAGGHFTWVVSPVNVVAQLGALRVKYVAKSAEAGDGMDVDTVLSTKDKLIEGFKAGKVMVAGESVDTIKPKHTIRFSTSPQPSFSKNLDLLADTINDYTLKGYKIYIATRNKAQMERLENAFHTVERHNLYFQNVPVSLSKGFIDHGSRVAVLTDHEIFERYYRYELKKQLKPSEALIASELNALSIGDYVVHIDHGVGRYGGLVKSMENGKVNEAVKIVYQGGDVLLVNVHSLHKISKYKDKDSETPKINKLGGSAWQKFKTAAKAKVKDIAKDLIALYVERKKTKGFAFSPSSYMQYELEASFMFEDTPDQQKATEAFKADMESETPMDRLVCGDVGFGKTEIAIRAAFKAVQDSKQVAVLVPTTLLSLQHYRTFSRRLKEFPVTVENFSRARSARDIKDIQERLREGKIDIIIGTHKLLGKDVEFKDLGLLIIDEEQKFGVANKEKLRKLKVNVDTMTLTATPIPRTLQFSLMGIRDLSVINTPPPNRIPVSTHVHSFDPELIKDAVEFELDRGGQVFFVHNRVRDIEKYASLLAELVPKAKIVVAHGQMKPSELEKKMMDFIYGEYDILVATTIIESGIDIPNVNTIIINDAQNFGLSDLHQLRGRVGRANRKAYAYLMIPSYETMTETARLRLKAIEEFSDLGAGFNIAMQDLDIRGAGNILGAEQSGFIADIGFETYNKILNEAMMELNEEQYALNETEGGEHALINEERIKYITDSQVDTDVEAVIPDGYISNVNEKIRFYRQIDKITTDAEVKAVRETLKDRFGPVPQETENLLNIVLLRKKAVELGFEKVIVKNGYFIVHLVYNQSSPYYQSHVYRSVLKYVSTAPAEDVKLKTKNNILLISMRGIDNMASAVGVLDRISDFVNKDFMENGIAG